MTPNAPEFMFVPFASTIFFRVNGRQGRASAEIVVVRLLRF
jgi:hypothetical protein